MVKPRLGVQHKRLNEIVVQTYIYKTKNNAQLYAGLSKQHNKQRSCVCSQRGRASCTFIRDSSHNQWNAFKSEVFSTQELQCLKSSLLLHQCSSDIFPHIQCFLEGPRWHIIPFSKSRIVHTLTASVWAKRSEVPETPLNSNLKKESNNLRVFRHDQNNIKSATGVGWWWGGGIFLPNM